MKKHKHAIRMQRLILAIVATGFTVAIMEVGLRVAYRQPHAYYVWPPNLNLRFVPDPELITGIVGESRFQTSGLGLRADELAAHHTERWLAIGGSTTECVLLDQDEAWPAQLQTRMNEGLAEPVHWIGNASRSGHTTRHHLMVMRDFPLDALAIEGVLVMPGINDLSLRLSQGEAFDPHAMEQPIHRETVRAEAFFGSYLPKPADPWYRRAQLWQLARRPWHWIRTRARSQDKAGRNVARWRAHRHGAPRLPDMPNLADGMGEYQRNLHALIDTAAAANVAIVFLTQPSAWSPDVTPEMETRFWMGGVGDFQAMSGQPYYTAAALAQGLDAYNALLREVCRERGVPCIDVAAVLGADPDYYYDDCHFTEAGASLIAQTVASTLRERPMLMSPPGKRAPAAD